MKGYGLPRLCGVNYPDLGDIAEFGLKTSTGQLLGKGGDFRGSSRTKNRNAARRYWKKTARANAKADIRNSY